MTKVRLASTIVALAFLMFAISELTKPDGQSAEARATVVDLRGEICGMPDGNGDPIFIVCSVFLAVEADSGNSMIIAKGQIPPPADGQVKHWSFETIGVRCNTSFGLTTDWQQVITPSGAVSIVCHVNPNPKP